MHYTKSYEGLTPIEKHNKAIDDIIEYLGQERFETLCVELKTTKPTLEQFEFLASLAGIQGYPVKAWYNYIFML